MSEEVEGWDVGDDNMCDVCVLKALCRASADDRLSTARIIMVQDKEIQVISNPPINMAAMRPYIALILMLPQDNLATDIWSQ